MTALNRVVAVIPARSGSKRIPRKNVRLFADRPMITWPIRAALNAAIFDRVVVSTDDPEIADIARAAGAEVPFMRPAEMADDHITLVDVMAHTVSELGLDADAEVCLIYATAPLLSPEHLAEGLRALRDAGSDFALAVASFPAPVQWALRVGEGGRIAMFDSGAAYTRSQDMEEAYFDAAQFCWGTGAAWLRRVSALLADTVPVILPRHVAQDIDNDEDWTTAEALFRAFDRGEY